MSYLLAIPITLVLLLLQTTLGGQVRLLNGNADLLLIWLAGWGLFSKDRSIWFWIMFAGLAVSYVSALPWYVTLAAYLAAGILSKLIQSRLWNTPLMSMFLVIIVSSILLYGLSFAGLTINGYSFLWKDTLVQVIIPSVFLNMLIGIIFYPLVRDTAQWAFKTEVE